MNEATPKVVWRRKRTLRNHGRRAVTPPRRGKTRGHVGKRHGLVPLFKSADSHNNQERPKEDKEEQCEHSERKGHEDSGDPGEGHANQAEHQEAHSEGGGVHSEMSVYPGTVQGLSGLSQDDEEDSETEAVTSLHPFFCRAVAAKGEGLSSSCLPERSPTPDDS